MKITYTHKNTKVTIERMGSIEPEEIKNLFDAINDNPKSVGVVYEDEMGGVFNGTQQDMIDFVRLGKKLTQTRQN